MFSLSFSFQLSLDLILIFLGSVVLQLASLLPSLSTVRLATEWPVESLFPVLALFRLLVARPSVAEHFAEPANIASLRAILDRCVPLDAASSASSSSSATSASAAVPASAQLMALCAASNLFARAAAGRVFACDEAIVRAAKVALASKAKVWHFACLL